MTTLVYDGDCAFCTSSVRLLLRLRVRADTVIAWQHADLPALGLTAEQCQAELQWVADDGVVSSGHEAVARLLLGSALPWRLCGRLLLVPPVSWLAARAYDWIADHPHRLPGAVDDHREVGDRGNKPAKRPAGGLGYLTRHRIAVPSQLEHFPIGHRGTNPYLDLRSDAGDRQHRG